MSEELNVIRRIIKDPLLKILGIALLAYGFYLDMTYVTKSDYAADKKEHLLEIKTLQRELDTLKVKFRLHAENQENKDILRDAEGTTLQRRFDTKVKLINRNTENINKNENLIIRIDEKIKK